MSLKLGHIGSIALVLIALAERPAAAQFVRDGDAELPESDSGGGDSKDDTDIDARVVTTAFVHRESGAAGDPLVDGGVAPDNASPFNRYFVDLRMAVAAKHIAGGKWEAHADGRVRGASEKRVQSGAVSGNEHELRELNVTRRGDRVELTLGRQTVGEIAATRIDGVRFDLVHSRRWRTVLFAGTYPERGSRSVDTDYPRVRTVGTDELGDRIIPVAAGAGASYRGRTLHGNVGLAGIAPWVDNPATGDRDEPRLFVSSSGYWRPSRRFSLYHYGVADLTGEAGAGLTNLSIGVLGTPVRNLRLRAALHHVDTELLAITAQNQLEDPDTASMGIVQNNIAVQRISSDSARAGASFAMAERRFELSVFGALRRRPEVAVELGDGGEFVFPETRAVDFTLSVLDRRSMFGLRIGASVTWVAGLGDDQPTRSDSRIARLFVSRTLAGGAGQWQLDVGYLRGEDANSGMPCSGGLGLDPLDCYGTSRMRAVQGGGLLAYPIAHRTILIADIHSSAQSVTAVDAMGDDIEQPTRYVTTGLFRVQRRF